jgi:hypothetical protein
VRDGQHKRVSRNTPVSGSTSASAATRSSAAARPSGAALAPVPAHPHVCTLPLAPALRIVAVYALCSWLLACQQRLCRTALTDAA